MFWQVAWYAFLVLGFATVAIALTSVVDLKTRRRLRRGGNLTKLAIRLLGRSRFVWSRNLLWACWLCAAFFNWHVYLVLGNIYLGLVVDDFLTGDDDDDRTKRRKKVRVKLRMPRPVFLRPVERY